MKQKSIIWIGGLLLLLVLGGGAYTAVNLLTAAPEEAAAPAGARVMESVAITNDGNPVAVRTTILPAEELPNEAAAAGGIVVSREDNTIVLGTGAIDLNVEVQIDPETGQETTEAVPSTSGPEIEVVITADTVIYRDITELEPNEGSESGEVTIQQQVRPANSADDIAEKMEMQVWGERRGDRIVATTIVFGPLAGGMFQ
ncbi:MAG: hypothetical protein QNJ45_17995 [Ardenticatenaceae bacterium]|nr:hypothetical protein [Ardenticatenaceae bacterium]